MVNLDIQGIMNSRNHILKWKSQRGHDTHIIVSKKAEHTGADIVGWGLMVLKLVTQK